VLTFLSDFFLLPLFFFLFTFAFLLLPYSAHFFE